MKPSLRLSGMDWIFVGLFLLFALPAVGLSVWALATWVTG